MAVTSSTMATSWNMVSTEQLHLCHVLGHLSHEQLHDLLLYSSHTSTTSNGGGVEDNFLDA
uniref:Uncharacterized protein n=1 Tax=Oryza punctata TaxID=4537 RepID=A0A0E0LT69_ORYPU